MVTNSVLPAYNADPLKRHACVQAIVRFVDGNVRTFYSRDIDCYAVASKKNLYHNLGHWVQYWKMRIQHELPAGWQGRVQEAAIFHSFDGNRGDKICQFDRTRGWDK